MVVELSELEMVYIPFIDGMHVDENQGIYFEQSRLYIASSVWRRLFFPFEVRRIKEHFKEHYTLNGLLNCGAFYIIDHICYRMPNSDYLMLHKVSTNKRNMLSAGDYSKLKKYYNKAGPAFKR